MSLVRDLQRRLERIYGVSVREDVADYLITDPELARQLDTSVDARTVKEKVLVSQNGEEVGITLYLDPGIVGRLVEDDPVRSLHEGNLDDYLLVLEGVSHFLYLAWHIAAERDVTLMELEMQAEVDKYVLTSILLRLQQRDYAPAHLHSVLFDQPSYDSELRPHELARYRDANRYAGKYCHQLEHRYRRRRRGDAMLHDLRHFWRLTHHAKIRHIEHAG